MDVEGRLDELFAAPLEDFTAARNALVKELSDLGEKDVAARVKAFRKPTITVWSINQLAHRHGPELEELIGLHERLTEAKGAEDLRRLSGERKRVVGRLTELATQILEDSGHAATGTTTQKISQMLLAASAGEELDALRWGRLTEEIEAQGFDAMSGFEDLSSEAAVAISRKEVERLAKLSRDAEEAAREAAKLTRAAASAEQDARRLEAKAERAQRKADEARKKAEEAHRKAEEAAQRI